MLVDLRDVGVDLAPFPPAASAHVGMSGGPVPPLDRCSLFTMIITEILSATEPSGQ